MADLLIELGHASRNQFDEYSHLDGNGWKEEGQLEKFNNFLESKKREMSMAKLNGQVNKYNELNSLSKYLSSEVYRNPKIIPVLAKALIEHEGIYSHSSNVEFQIIDSIVKPDDQITNTQKNNFNNIYSDATLILKNTMASIIENNKSLGQVNSLLEMTNGQIADHFIASKSDAELKQSIQNLENGKNNVDACAYNSQDHFAILNGISDIFQIAAYQQSGSYRTPAKIIMPKPKLKPKKKQKPKTGLSTLAIIREESRLTGNSKKNQRYPGKPAKNKQAYTKQTKSVPNIHFNEYKMRLKTN